MNLSRSPTNKENHMRQPAEIIQQALVAFLARTGPRDRSSERGDVPGWVMVTVMTAGLVAALWAVAGPELERMLRDALGSVA
jgi:hypothetical protein